MKRMIFILVGMTLVLAACAPATRVGAVTPPYVDTGVDPESWSLVPALSKLIKFTHIANTGAAFGMFPQLGNIFMVIAVIVIAGIIIFHKQLPTENIWVRISLGLQLGGAMGNLVDRILRGYVVDFVDIGFWPIFNIADLSIVVGVTILAYHLWDEEQVPNSSHNMQVLSEKKAYE